MCRPASQTRRDHQHGHRLPLRQRRPTRRSAHHPHRQKALAALASQGLVENVSFGVWRFALAEGGDAVTLLDDDLDAEADGDDESDEMFSAGPQCVYVYDYPTNAEHAAAHSKGR